MKIKKFKKIKAVTIKPEGQPDIYPITPELYKLDEDWGWTWYVNTPGELMRISINAGFVCDGQSSPRFAYPLLRYRPDGIVRAAALVHDVLYRNKGLGSDDYYCILYRPHDDNTPLRFSRKAADQIYKATYVAAIEGCGIFGRDKRREVRKAKMGYVILRMFGWIYWGSKNPPRG